MKCEHQEVLLKIPLGPIKGMLKRHLIQNKENKQLTQISKEATHNTDNNPKELVKWLFNYSVLQK